MQQNQPSTQHQQAPPTREVIVKDVDISFGQMVILLVKLAIGILARVERAWFFFESLHTVPPIRGDKFRETRGFLAAYLVGFVDCGKGAGRIYTRFPFASRYSAGFVFGN
jgi:hypothetical protein